MGSANASKLFAECVSDDCEPESIKLGMSTVVFGYVKHYGMIECTDQLIAKTSNHKANLSHGEIVGLVVTKLASERPSTLTELVDFGNRNPVAAWLGNPFFVPWMLNRYVTGATLDAVADFGCCEFYAKSVDSILSRSGKFDLKKVIAANFDTTSYHVHGDLIPFVPQVDPDNVEAWPEDTVTIEVKHGYSRDNHPELRQLNHFVAVGRMGREGLALPLYHAVTSGNTSDITFFAEFAENGMKRLKAMCPNLRYMIGDSAAATYRVAYGTRLIGLELITRLPDSLKVVKNTFDKARKGEIKFQTYILREATEHEPAVEVQLAKAGTYSFKDKKHKDAQPVEGQIIIVKADSMRDLKTQTIQHKAEQELASKTSAVAAIATACLEDAKKMMHDITKSSKFCVFEDIKYEEKWQYSKRGRPSRDAKPDKRVFVATATIKLDQHAIEEAIEKELLYVLWCGDSKASAADIYDYYHQQVDCESGWRAIKSPKFFVDSFYVRSVKRAMALCTLIALALLIQRLIMNDVRTYLKESGQAIGKLSSNRPTQTPAWDTLVRGFDDTNIRFSLALDRVKVDDLDSFAIDFLRQSPSEVQELFSSKYLADYATPFVLGYLHTIQSKQGLRKEAPRSWHRAKVPVLKTDASANNHPPNP